MICVDDEYDDDDDKLEKSKFPVTVQAAHAVPWTVENGQEMFLKNASLR